MNEIICAPCACYFAQGGGNDKRRVWRFLSIVLLESVPEANHGKRLRMRD
ncbi:MAG: hypothetical protein K2H04_05990 [Bacteroidaceae bacterium]|nr:hypothetical protein [Bacteroidaceae bacterium]